MQKRLQMLCTLPTQNKDHRWYMFFYACDAGCVSVKLARRCVAVLFVHSKLRIWNEIKGRDKRTNCENTAVYFYVRLLFIRSNKEARFARIHMYNSRICYFVAACVFEYCMFASKMRKKNRISVVCFFHSGHTVCMCAYILWFFSVNVELLLALWTEIYAWRQRTSPPLGSLDLPKHVVHVHILCVDFSVAIPLYRLALPCLALPCFAWLALPVL